MSLHSLHLCFRETIRNIKEILLVIPLVETPFVTMKILKEDLKHNNNSKETLKRLVKKHKIMVLQQLFR